MFRVISLREFEPDLVPVRSEDTSESRVTLAFSVDLPSTLNAFYSID